MYDVPLSVIATRCHPPQGAFSCPTGNSPCLPEERLVFLPKVLAAYTTLPSARKARSHLRYTKNHFSCNEKCWSCYTRRVFQGRYNRLDLRLQFAITISLYMLPERELAKSHSDFDWGLCKAKNVKVICVAAPFRLTTFGTFPKGQARLIA